MNKHLLIIDPQFDFCDPSGALYVKGAENDMDRLAAFIDKNGDLINHISVTLDSHHKFDIAHPTFWVDNDGNHPTPFTMITSKDIESGRWRTAMSDPDELDEDALKYTKALERGGKYSLIIWPEHCLIGSRGHSIHDGLFKSLMRWSNTNKQVNFVTKGENQFTEHYSAIKPEVIREGDEVKQWFVDLLEESDEILVAGEALSHCVAATVTDIADHFKNQNSIKRITLLEDCTSSVTGFEKSGKDFINLMGSRGMRLRKSTTDYKFIV